ncbi:MAG: hypothetical protein ABR569_06920 [Gaiellaceae bacterium]
MRFLRRPRAVRRRLSFNEELELVYWRTLAEIEPLLRPEVPARLAA